MTVSRSRVSECYNLRLRLKSHAKANVSTQKAPTSARPRLPITNVDPWRARDSGAPTRSRSQAPDCLSSLLRLANAALTAPKYEHRWGSPSIDGCVVAKSSVEH